MVEPRRVYVLPGGERFANDQRNAPNKKALEMTKNGLLFQLFVELGKEELRRERRVSGPGLVRIAKCSVQGEAAFVGKNK